MTTSGESIEREISSLYRQIGLQAIAGNGDEVNRLRDQLSELESRKLEAKKPKGRNP